MALRILWDKYETALLIDLYLNIDRGDIDRNTGVSELSKRLRKRAIDAGVVIDDIYRNENGITLQLMKIDGLMRKHQDAEKHNTKIFIDMVNMYFTNRDQFDLILKEAKGVRPVNSKQDQFFAWLSKEVPSFRMSDYFFAISDLEGFARKKRLITGSLFDVDDSVITGKLVSTVNADRIFRFTHKKQIKHIIDLAQYFHNYTKIQCAARTNDQPVIEVDKSVTDAAVSTLEIPNSHKLSSPPIEKMPFQQPEELLDSDNSNKTSENQVDDAIPMLEKSKEIASVPSEIIQEQDKIFVVDFINESDYSFTRPISLSYFGETSQVSSWRKIYVKICQLMLEDYSDDIQNLRDNEGGGSGVYILISDHNGSKKLAAPVEIGNNCYVETNRSASELIHNIKLLLDYCRVDYENLIIRYEKKQAKSDDEAPIIKSTDVPSVMEEPFSVEASDPVIIYLKQLGLEYFDFRHKLGCLWIVGGREITEKMAALQKNGVRMHFRAGGGNATNGRDAWWTKDFASAPIECLSANEEKSDTTFKPETISPKRCSIQEGRSSYISWMEANGIGHNSARTAAWALTKVSEIAIEQGIVIDPLYTICGAGEVAHILKQLEDNVIFQDYRRQNTVALFAARKYAAFRAEQENGTIPTSAVNVQKRPEDNDDAIQEARRNFTEYILNRKYSTSTARGMTSAVSGVSDYANEHGFLEKSLFLIKEYSQLQSFWSRLQIDSDFFEYNRSQNRRFTVAMNHYLTYIRDSGDITTCTDAVEKPISITSQSNVHPGRIEFENWLKDNGCPAGSIKTYASCVDNIGNYLLDNDLEDRSIFAIRGVVRLEKIRTNLLTDKAYEVKVGGGSARLDWYALKRYIAFRRNGSSGGDLDETTFERFSSILRDNFENGFRINSMIDRNRFKQFYEDAYGEVLSETDEQIVAILKQLGSLQDDRIFFRESENQNDLLDDIQADIARTFKIGISCIYLSELFRQYQDQLTEELQVFSSDVLKELLLSTSYGAYRASKHYFYLRDRSPDASADIERLMRRSNIPLSYTEIYEKLRFIPLDTIKHSLVVMDKMVNVSQETYFYAPNLPVNADELNQISELIHKQLQQKSFITDNELRGLIVQYCPSVAINTETYTTWGLRNALSVLLDDRYSFNGPIISERGEKINMAQAYAEFCRSHETMTMDELKQFAKEMNTVIYWEPVYEEMVRISQDEFIAKDQVHFDIPATDTVLDELISGDYLALQEFTLFLHFPVIDIRWNTFVLESYVANYSKNFTLLHASYTATDCCGAVVRKDSSIADFKSLITDVLSRSDRWKDKNDALALLVEKGYLQRRRYSEIDFVILEAKQRRDSLKK